MSLRKFLLGVTVGIIGTYAFQKYKPAYISSDAALRKVKQEVKKHGPIDGSWIHMVPEEFFKNNITYTVYRGGISRTIHDQQEHLEFIVNAENGTILDIQEVHV